MDWREVTRHVLLALSQVDHDSPPFSTREDPLEVGADGATLYRPGAALPSEPLTLLRLIACSVTVNERANFVSLLLKASTPHLAPTTVQLLIDWNSLDTIGVLPTDTLAAALYGAERRVSVEGLTLGTEVLDNLRVLVDLGCGRFNQAHPVAVQPDSPERRLRKAALQLRASLNLVEYVRLRQTLVVGENPEINTDREHLVSRYRELGLTGDVAGALDRIDRTFATAQDEFDFKAVMGQVRSVLEDVAASSARVEIATTGARATVADVAPRFSECLRALKQTGLMSETESVALQKFHDFISVEGAHALSSAREQARLSKNMMIEWALLILTRVRSTTVA
ncbi:MAG TPA: hypothetical protein VM364_00475 [Vicinamibacterales bacterium]|nr:hypothetical protein [Vicinamibacterales bacterium]